MAEIAALQPCPTISQTAAAVIITDSRPEPFRRLKDISSGRPWSHWSRFVFVVARLALSFVPVPSSKSALICDHDACLRSEMGLHPWPR
jgi:hypothetical protein